MLVKLKIWRSTPTADGREKRELVDFQVDTFEEATLLDVLDEVKHHHDGTLAYRKSCRMAICGSCGMRMDGKAVLACKTPMKELAAAGRVPVIAPMGNMPVVRDLVTDMADFWNKVRAMTPWLTRGDRPERPADGREFLVTPEQQAMINKESLCIMCGCCVSECNSMEADPAFIGPAALAKGYRFVGDIRDQKTKERLEAANGKHGVWDCTRCYFCNERCPKGVDPRDAIAKLGAAMFDHGMTGDKGAKHAKVFVDSSKGVGALPGTELLYNGHLSETALVPLTLGPEVLKPGWLAFGAKLNMRGKAPPPWHAALHRQKGLDEVRKLWRILEREESTDRRGGDLDTPVVPMAPNIARGLLKTFTPEEIYAKTGAVVSSDVTVGGGKEPEDKVDLATYYGTDSIVAKIVTGRHGVADGGGSAQAATPDATPSTNGGDSVNGTDTAHDD